jgi:hypothetical protein
LLTFIGTVPTFIGAAGRMPVRSLFFLVAPKTATSLFRSIEAA